MEPLEKQTPREQEVSDFINEISEAIITSFDPKEQKHIINQVSVNVVSHYDVQRTEHLEQAETLAKKIEIFQNS